MIFLFLLISYYSNYEDSEIFNSKSDVHNNVYIGKIVKILKKKLISFI